MRTAVEISLYPLDADYVPPIKDFIERAKANPGKLTYGSAGNGSVNHLLGAMFGKSAGVQLVHVPYKGAGPAVPPPPAPPAPAPGNP